MNISEIKAAVDAARERQAKGLQDCPFCGRLAELQVFSFNSVKCDDRDCPGVSGAEKSDWNNRPAQEQADTALIALWGIYEVLKAELESDYNSFCEEEFNAGGR